LIFAIAPSAIATASADAVHAAALDRFRNADALIGTHAERGPQTALAHARLAAAHLTALQTATRARVADRRARHADVDNVFGIAGWIARAIAAQRHALLLRRALHAHRDAQVRALIALRADARGKKHALVVANAEAVAVRVQHDPTSGLRTDTRRAGLQAQGHVDVGREQLGRLERAAISFGLWSHLGRHRKTLGDIEARGARALHRAFALIEVGQAGGDGGRPARALNTGHRRAAAGIAVRRDHAVAQIVENQPEVSEISRGHGGDRTALHAHLAVFDAERADQHGRAVIGFAHLDFERQCGCVLVELLAVLKQHGRALRNLEADLVDVFGHRHVCVDGDHQASAHGRLLVELARARQNQAEAHPVCVAQTRSRAR
jgi:hypothetical protein